MEIWLTSEDTGAYGRDIGTNLPELLQEILDVLPEGTMLRLGMTNPPYIMEHLDRISQLLKHPRMYVGVSCEHTCVMDSYPRLVSEKLKLV